MSSEGNSVIFHDKLEEFNVRLYCEVSNNLLVIIGETVKKHYFDYINDIKNKSKFNKIYSLCLIIYTKLNNSNLMIVTYIFLLVSQNRFYFVVCVVFLKAKVTKFNYIML